MLLALLATSLLLFGRAFELDEENEAIPLPLLPSFTEETRKVKRRALLITCDDFVSMPDTLGACEKNAETIRECLRYPGFGFEDIQYSYGLIGDEIDFANTVITTFEQSDDNDLNLIYISTHGLYDPVQLREGALVLSDGTKEALLDANEIDAVLQQIAGKKLLIIDACYSGALIGKGVSGGGFGHPFLDARIMILTSSGGSELSWYWQENENSGLKLVGAGYFSAMLAQGLNPEDAYPADLNHNMEITLKELYEYLYKNHSASVVQVYPQNDDTLLLELPALEWGLKPQLGNIRFYNSFIDIQHPNIHFSFQVEAPVVPLYQIVYHRKGRWDFENAEYIYDHAALDENESLVPLQPNTYRRSIGLKPDASQSTGYAMINLLSREGSYLKFLGSQVIAILQEQGLTDMEVKTSPAFQPLYGQELPIIVSHNIPCLLSISIVDEQGQTVYNISEQRMTRPENLKPDGSFFVWNGKRADGSFALPGTYRVRSIGLLQNQYYENYSKPFEVLKETEQSNGG